MVRRCASFEPFDDDHAATAAGTETCCFRLGGIGAACFDGIHGNDWRHEQLAGAGDVLGALAAGEAPSRHFARGPNGGLIVTGNAAAIGHRNLIAALAARHRLPAVYPSRFYANDGGLVAYGPELHRPVSACCRLRRTHPQGREAG